MNRSAAQKLSPRDQGATQVAAVCRQPIASLGANVMHVYFASYNAPRLWVVLVLCFYSLIKSQYRPTTATITGSLMTASVATTAPVRAYLLHSVSVFGSWVGQTS